MAKTNADLTGDHGEYMERVCDKEHPRLRRYFMRQVGNVAEAEEYVQETFRRLLIFMEGKDWEKEEEYISVYLMRLAALLSFEKLWAGPPHY